MSNSVMIIKAGNADDEVRLTDLFQSVLDLISQGYGIYGLPPSVMGDLSFASFSILISQITLQ